MKYYFQYLLIPILYALTLFQEIAIAIKATNRIIGDDIKNHQRFYGK